VDFIEHADLRVEQRIFDPSIVISAILGGVVIQEFPSHQPLPRMVFRSTESTYEPIEVVCDVDYEEERVIIVTVKFGKIRKKGYSKTNKK
jgi:hypothetical protein